MPRSFPVDWMDAFADAPFGGNGCAVVHGGAGLDAETAMQFVRETSLVECTFTGPSDIADVRVRYFLASREIPFAGHPTVATVAALKARGLMKGDSITLETGAGVVPVTVRDGWVEMTQVAPEFGVSPDPQLVADAVGLKADDIVSPPQLVSTGLPFVITVLSGHNALRRAQLDHDALARLCADLGYQDIDMMEPFLVTQQGATDAGHTFSRLLLAPPSPPEDPFTGSATGAMAAYLWKHGMMAQDSFVAEQGHWLGRPGQARVSRVGPVDEMTGIRVAGQAWRLMSGDLHL